MGSSATNATHWLPNVIGEAGDLVPHAVERKQETTILGSLFNLRLRIQQAKETQLTWERRLVRDLQL